jgi:hypothetical protein
MTSNARYTATGYGYKVVDTHTGKVVYQGQSQSDQSAYLAQHNAGHVQMFELWKTLTTNFVAQALVAHRLPWSIQLPELGAHIVAGDGSVIISVDDVQTAGFVIKLAEQLELERYPDGRR